MIGGMDSLSLTASTTYEGFADEGEEPMGQWQVGRHVVVLFIDFGACFFYRF